MSAIPLPMGTIPCVACGGPAAMKTNPGEVRVVLTTKSGSGLTITGPICLACANRAVEGNEARLEILTAAVPKLIER